MASKFIVKCILKLREKKVSQNAITSTLSVSKHSIKEFCRVAEKFGVTYSDVTRNAASSKGQVSNTFSKV